MALLETIDPSAFGAIARSVPMVRRLLPQPSEETSEIRIRIVHHETTYAVERWLRVNGPIGLGNQRSYEALVEAVTDFMTAGLAGPVGALPLRRPGA